MTHSSTEMMASSIDSLALSFSLHKFLPPFWSKSAGVYAAPGSRTSTPGLSDAMSMAS